MANDFEYVTVNIGCNYRADSWAIIWVPVLILNLAIACAVSVKLTVTIFTQMYKSELKKNGLVDERRSNDSEIEPTRTEVTSSEITASVNQTDVAPQMQADTDTLQVAAEATEQLPISENAGPEPNSLSETQPLLS